MGDLNTIVGNKRYFEIVGKFIIGIRKEHGGKWVQWCTVNGQVIANTWFQHIQDEYGYGKDLEKKQRTRGTI